MIRTSMLSLGSAAVLLAAADKGAGSNAGAAAAKVEGNASQPANTAPAGNAGTAAASTEAAKPEIKIATKRTDIPLPADTSGGRGGQTLYPFDELEVNESFHVTGKKSMASTVSSANARNTTELTDAAGVKSKTVNKQFKAAKVGKDDPDGEGIRVWRIK